MITRRDLGKLATGIGAAALATPLRVAGAATSRPTLTIAVDNLWPTMAPINGISTTTVRIFPNFYEILIERDFTKSALGLDLAPRLATKWERNGTVWSIELRQGVKFHNGEEMTADDVAFTLSADRLWGPKPIEPRGKTFTGGFKRVTATGKYSIEIETERPDPNIPGKLTGYIGFVVPKKYYLDVGVDAFGQKPIGAGPYKVTSFNSSDSMVLEAFDDYYGAPPPAQKLIWKIVPEFAARMAGLVSGEFDFIVNIPTDQEKVVAGYKGVKVVRKTADNYPGIVINTLPDPPNNPLVDPNLRHALVQALDMDTIVKSLFGDNTFHPAVPFNFPEYGKFYDADRKPLYPFDPDQAKKLVKASKYDGSPLLFHITRQFYPNYEDAAQIMVAQWADAGLNVQIQVLDNFDLVYRRPYHLMNISNSTNFVPGDPYQPLWLDWGPSGTPHTTAWKSWDLPAHYVELGNAFDSAVDFDERKKAYIALAREWEQITPCFWLWKTVANWGQRDNINWTPISTAEMRMYGDYLKFT